MQEVSWFPVAQFRRVAKDGVSMTYSGAGKLTFSNTLGAVLEAQRVAFGQMEDGRLCLTMALPTPSGLLVRRRQVSDATLRRHCKGLEPGTRFHFEFHPERGFFIESRRDRIGNAGGADDTIGATRQPAELQP